MRRRLAVAVVCALAALTIPLSAAGTVSVTTAIVGGGITKYTVAWTSTAGGAVSGNAFSVVRGELLQIKYVPGAGGTQPSDLYDVTVVDQDSVDVAMGTGANLSNAAATIKPALHSSSSVRVLLDGTQTLDVVVANAGSAKTGTVILWIGR